MTRLSAAAERVCVAAITVVGAVLVLLHLSRRSFELDETFSAALVRTPAHTFWHIVTQREANSAGFYLLIRAWSHLFRGDLTEGWERLPTALAAVAVIPVVWLIARRLAPGLPAVLAPGLLLLNGFFVRVAQFGRGYGFVVLFTTLASLAFVIAVQTGSVRARWAWTVLIAVGAYFHALAVLVLVAHLVALVVLAVVDPDTRAALRAWIAPVVAVGVLIAPLALFFLFRSGDQLFWVPATTVQGIITLLTTIVGNAGKSLLVVVVLAAAPALLALWRDRDEGRQRDEIVVALCWLIVPLVAGIAVSLAKPLLVNIYFAIIIPPLAIVMAIGLTALPRIAGAVLLVALLVLGGRSTYRTVTATSVQNWRAATAYLMQHTEQGDRFAVQLPDERAGVEYYVDRAPAALPRPVPCFPSDPWGRLAPVSGRRPAGAVAAVARCVAGAQRLWLEYRPNDHLIVTPLSVPGWHRASAAMFTNVEVDLLVPAGP